MRERVLMHKESGELCVLTNKFWGEVHMSTLFIDYNGGFSADWNDDDFVELGFL